MLKIMGEQLDYATLKWIKDEIQESLNQTQQALEAFIEDSSDTTQIRFCAAYLHQVLGTLQMVEIYGAALLAEEMEKVANALLNEKISQKDDAFDVLIRAIIQLPAYLEGLERGQADMPVVLTPLLNDLRAARGEPLLSENAFFSPDISVSPPEKHLSSDKEFPEIQVYARKLRTIYQVALLGWFKSENVDASLKKLSAVLSELQNASTMEETQRLWWVSGGISEALLDEGLETSVSVKMLMGKVDREIKKLIDNGEDAIVTENPVELLKNCLYYVGLSKSNGPRVSSLKQAFDLDRLLPYSGDVDQAMDDLKGSTDEIMESVSSVIKEDLLHVKDQLDIFVRSSDRNLDDLVALGEVLDRTADTLAMLSLADLRKVIQDQVTNIEKMVADAADPDDNSLMEIASALLYVESSLDTLKESNREHSESEAPDLAVHEQDGDEGNVVLLPSSEQSQITNLVIKEAREVLAEVKEGFNTFAVEPERFDVIAESPAKLVQIQGALAVMNLDRAANLLGAAIAYISNDMLAEQENIDASRLDVLADAITSIEYYLEAIEEGRGQPENVLAVAEISVEQLGYPVSGEYSITDTASGDEVVGESLPDSEIEFDFSEDPDLLAETDKADDEAPVITEEPAVGFETNLDIAEVLLAEGPDDEYLDEDIDEEILEIFVEEADEVLGTMTDCLHAWRADNSDVKSLETLRRSYHTLKGSGRLAGAMVMGEFAWAMESLLNRVMEGKSEAGPSMFKLLEQSEVTLNRLLANLKGETDQRPPVKRLQDLAIAFAEGKDFSVSDVLPDVAQGMAPEAVPDISDAEPEKSTETEEASSFDPVLAQVFRKETVTHLAALNEYLNKYSGVDSAPVNDVVHRALHTLHGSARMAGVFSIAEISEPMDRLVRAMHEREMTLDADGLALLKEFTLAAESLAENFDSEQTGTAEFGDMLSRIVGLHEQVLAVPMPESKGSDIEGFAVTGAAGFEEDAGVVDVFLDETTDILANIDEFMQQWASAIGDLEIIAELRRAMHNIKGGARLAGLTPVADLMHELESALELVTEGEKEVTEELPILVQRALDWLLHSVEIIKSDGVVEPAVDVLRQIEEFKSSVAGGSDPLALDDLDIEIFSDVEADLPSAEVIEIEESIVEEPIAEEFSMGEDLPPTEIIEIEEPLVVEPVAIEEIESVEEEYEELEEVVEIQAEPIEDISETASAEVDYDPDLLEVFLEEADEIQEETERVLYEWSDDFENTAHIENMQRSLHTLKGGARMANVVAVGDLAHAMESLLERVADGRMSPAPEHPDLMQTCHDWMVRALEQAKKLQPIIPAAELVEQIEALISGKKYVPLKTTPPKAEADIAPIVIKEAPAPKQVDVDPGSLSEAETEVISDTITFGDQKKSTIEDLTAATGSDEQVRVRADLLNNLVNFSGEINIYNSRITQQLGSSRYNLTELAQTVTRIHNQLRNFEIETETQIMYRHETTSGDSEDFDPLELDRFSTMQQLSRGMVESLGDLTSIQKLLENQSSETDVLLLQQQRVTGELQDGLMRTRMVAFSSVLPRLRRIVRQTCKEIGKKADLHVSGDEGELDRTQLNRLVPALEHILRNAIDHGMETPEEREKLGKPSTGNVNITFHHEGSEVVLTITDDGRGIDIAALRKKAVEKGRMLEDADLSDSEIIEFILESGFSTAEKVTQISGRGVGMDVVNNEIKQLGGSLHIDSKEGEGSTFKLHLPLTVLVNQALMVQSVDSTYAIQLPNIEHVVRLGREELKPMVENDQAIFEYAGNQYQYINLGTVLHGAEPVLPEQRQRVPLMLMRTADHRVALHVDNLLGRQEIVIKSVGPQLSSVGVLSGATILPSGEVALILDVGNLVRSALAQKHGKAEPLLPTIEAATEEDKTLTVMIVDDSITVRKVTERLLNRYEYNIITAKDGVDALTVLLEQIPDVMLLDVEMPRMDGFELATTMRNDDRLKDIPIIMITSRTGDKHRKRAMGIGVNMYMGKPYQEQDLIENICTLTGTEKSS
jgi:chemosensory pili system protein ChpA (sensor histidine kinase/response regulator)